MSGVYFFRFLETIFLLSPFEKLHHSLFYLPILFLAFLSSSMFQMYLWPSLNFLLRSVFLIHKQQHSKYNFYKFLLFSQLRLFVHSRLKPAKRTPPNISRNKSSNTQRTENKTTDVVIHQHSRKLLKMDILMSETCWAHNKWNKIASDIRLVFHSSTIKISRLWWHFDM